MKRQLLRFNVTVPYSEAVYNKLPASHTFAAASSLEDNYASCSLQLFSPLLITSVLHKITLFTLNVSLGILLLHLALDGEICFRRRIFRIIHLQVRLS